MKILIVDDNVDFASTIADIIYSFGYTSFCINSPTEAIAFMEENYQDISLILLDIEFGFGEKMNGLDLLDIFRRNYIQIPIVMVTGKGTIETAVKATKLGAVNFIEKNIITKEKLRNIIDSTINSNKIKSEDYEIRNFLASLGIIGVSKVTLEIGNSVVRYGRTDLNILVTGETGTGKKLIAKALHSISSRMRNAFITVDIPNIPKVHFQSELFGYIKGAFPGANETKKGLFQEAHKGTLFLDEVGDLPIDLQSNLLSPIEEKIVRKFGALENEEVDVRFISATDKNLPEMMKAGTFREQLYHRLRECEIYIPALRERTEDIPEIVAYYTSLHNQDFNDNKIFSQSAIDYLTEQDWPGNVRELASVVRVILQTIQKEEIDSTDVIKLLSTRTSKQQRLIDISSAISHTRTLKEDLAEVDRIKIEKTLEQNNGNVSKSAAILGVSRETLHNKIKRYGINTSSFRKKRS